CAGGRPAARVPGNDDSIPDGTNPAQQPAPTRSDTAKNVPQSGNWVSRHSSKTKPSTVSASFRPMEAEMEFSGIRASFTSEPGASSAFTSTGLMLLMPLANSNPSPQLITCLPARTLRGISPTHQLPQTKASRISALEPELGLGRRWLPLAVCQ